MISVQDFRTRTRVYDLREDGGLDSRVASYVAKVGRPPSVGFGEVISSTFGRDRVGVALYATEQELRLAIDGERFDLLRPDIRAERITVLPFIKKFTIWRGSESVLSFKYLHSDVFDDPHAGTKDILKFVSETTASCERRHRFYLVWRSIQLGQDVTSDDARTRIEEAVRRSCHEA